METTEKALLRATSGAGGSGGNGGRQSSARQALTFLVFMAVAGYLIGGSSLGVILVVGIGSVVAISAIARASRSYWAAAPGVLRYASANSQLQLVARLPLGRILTLCGATIAGGVGVAVLLEIARARQSPRPDDVGGDSPLWGGALPGGQPMPGMESLLRSARIFGSDQLLWEGWLLWAAGLLLVAALAVLGGVVVTWRKGRGLVLTPEGIVVRSGLRRVSASWDEIREIDVVGHWGVRSLRIDVGSSKPVWISGVLMGSDPEWAARLLELYRQRSDERPLLDAPEEALRNLERHYESKEFRP